MAVPADDRHPRLRQPELRADHVDDPLAAASGREQGDAELLAVAAQSVELRLGERIGDRAFLGRDVVIHRRERQIRPPHPPVGEPQAVESLRRGDLVDQVQIDEDDGGLALGLGHEMALPDPLEQGLCHANHASQAGVTNTVSADGVSPCPVAPAVRLRGDRAVEAGAASGGERRDRPRLRQPRPRLAGGRGREAGRGGREPAQPPLLDESRHSEAAQGDLRPLPGSLRRRARSRDPGGRDDRCEGGAGAPDVGARRAGRQRGRARAGVSDPPLRAHSRRRERDPGRARRQQRRALRPARRRVRAVAAAPTRPDRLVPAQPDDARRRPRVHGAARGAGARERGARRARLRLRGRLVRRLPAAFDPPGPRRRTRSRSRPTR